MFAPAAKTVWVTGAAGFIGFHLSRALANVGFNVVGIDNLNDYYSVDLKKARLAQLAGLSEFQFHKIDLVDKAALFALAEREQPTHIINLAAQAGVRYSLENPDVYIQSNLVGFGHVLELARKHQVEHLVYASSSSVYGSNSKVPFSTADPVDHPVSLYAATKKANELMAHSYSHLYNIPTTGLRFFTVYGPWGRPDMAAYLFTKAIEEGRPIDVFNFGRMKRDFTYVDDVVEGVIRVMQDPPTETPPYRVYNIGNHQPVELGRFIEILEEALGKKAIRNELPLQPGDVLETYADVEDLAQAINFRPNTPLEEGLANFVTWYREYHRA